jgi:predicted esterase
MEKFSRNPKIFISGLSLGGAITFKLCLKNPDKYSGALLFSPALREVTSDRYYLKKIGKILGSFFPRYTLLSQNNNNATKYDLSEEIKKDLYNYNGSNVLGSVKIVLTVME